MAWLLPDKLAEPTPDTRPAVVAAREMALIRECQAAAKIADQVYADQVAALVVDALSTWCRIGYRFGSSAQMRRLAAQVMADARAKGLA